MVAAWDSRFGAILHYPADTFAASARLARGSQYEALFRESICVLCLMFSPTQRPTTACRSGHVWQGQGASVCAQRSRLPFTAIPSKPHGARSAILHFTPEPSPRPLCLTGRAEGLRTLTGDFCALVPHPVLCPLCGRTVLRRTIGERRSLPGERTGRMDCVPNCVPRNALL